MRRLLFTATMLLLGCHASLAQVSTMGTTAMGLSSTPGTILSSPLNGPSPFSSATQPGVPDTTLAPVPLALDPTAPGTSVNCSPVSAQTAFPAQTISSAPLTASAMSSGATTSSTFAGPPGTIVPLGTSLPPGTIVILPQGTIEPQGTIVVTPGTTVTQGTSVVSTASTSTTTAMPLAPSATTSTSISGSTTGTIAPITLGNSTVTGACSLSPGSLSVNGAALPLSTPQIPASPAPGTIEPDVTQLGGTSIAPAMAVMPTPNTSACAESVTMYLTTPGMMAPANASGALATPGVSSPTPPSGC